MSTCGYEYHYKNSYFKCLDLVHNREATRCVFHDTNYLEGHTYEKNKEEVANRFNRKLSKHSSNNLPLEFIGYCLPDVSFQNKQFTGAIRFNDARFCGRAEFALATFSQRAYFRFAKFYGNTDFSSVTFSGGALFRGAKFYGNTDFSSVTFSGGANFNGAAFSEEASFRSATFSEASFSSVTFSGKANFSFAIFSGRAMFYKAKFSKEADFPSAIFSHLAYFPSTIFSGPTSFKSAELSYATFRSSIFSGDVYFSQAIFFGESDFTGTIFKTAIFSEAGFSKGANFGGAAFSNGAYFYGATFCKQANFGGAAFSNGALFNESTFSNGANFAQANFEGEAKFSSSLFKEGVTFSSSLFKEGGVADFVGANFKRADFSWANFEGIVNFAQANFEGEAKFYGANFREGGIAYFHKIEFKGEADFSRAAFFDRTYFSGNFNGEARFNRVLFDGREKIDFDVENLSNVSFMNTDITRVRFSEAARWGIGKKDKDRFKVIEERWLEDSPNKIKNLGSVMAVYRNVRENYEFRLRYDEAGKFFIREMELKRRYREVKSEGSNITTKQNCWFRRNLSLTGLYYRFSKYGESIARPTIIGIITIALSTLFWLIQKDPTKDPSFSNFVGAYWILHLNTNYLERAFERSLADFLPLLSLPTGISQGLVDYITKIVGGVLTFGLLAIALRRKFERKYTR